MPGSRRAVPIQDRSRVFACARTVLHARAPLTPAIIFRARSLARRLALPGNCLLDASWAGSQGGQGQEFLGVRECLAHIAVHRLQPGNLARGSFEAVRRDSQGRCRSSKRIFLRSGVSTWCIAVISGYSSISICVNAQFPSCIVVPQWVGLLIRSPRTIENLISSSLIVTVRLIRFI